jgi:hypothetical protein
MSMQRGFAPRWWGLTVAGIGLLGASPALALDKQGSAHGGDVTADTSGFGFSGNLALGASLYNPTYAARPDNTGHALFRYAAHADVDLIGKLLSIPLDINFFTDRDRPGAEKLVPSEFDIIAGVTTTWALPVGAVELGSRAESDMNVDRGSYSQTYVDARARYLYSLANHVPDAARTMRGNVTGVATLGAFLFNPTYAARPDNSGLALMRYALHGEASFLESHLAVGLDATMFTDRHYHPLTPSELDLTPELVGRFEPYEVHLAYERDMPIAEPANLSVSHAPHVQHFVYLLAAWAFDAMPSSAAAPVGPSTEPPCDPETQPATTQQQQRTAARSTR